jgi:hypothetical protein
LTFYTRHETIHYRQNGIPKMTESTEREMMNGLNASIFLAEHLTGQHCKTAKQWHFALQNNRSPTRTHTFHIPFHKIGKVIYYAKDDLTKFIEAEKMRELGVMKQSPRVAETLRAFGVGEIGGSPTGRKFELTALTPQVDGITGKTFAQMILNNPSMVYRLEPQDLQRLRKEVCGVDDCLSRLIADHLPKKT